jgi:hypothetical protein
MNSNNTRLPGFLRKGKQGLEDQSMTDYDIGLNIFSTKNFRPKSAKKFRSKTKIKSSIYKTGPEYSRYQKLS